MGKVPKGRRSFKSHWYRGKRSNRQQSNDFSMPQINVSPFANLNGSEYINVTPEASNADISSVETCRSMEYGEPAQPIITPSPVEFSFIKEKVGHKFRPPEDKSHPVSSAKRLNFTAEGSARRSIEDMVEYISSLLPVLVVKLQSSGIFLKFQRLIELIVEDKFPTDNIAFLLLLETVMWYTLQDKRCMEYSDSALQFWKVGYRLCHGTFLRFMSGSSGNDSDINFAVPTLKTLLKYEPFDLPDELSPGIIDAALDLKANDDRFQVLGFDGKKVATGLTKDHGEEDLFGHEKGLSLIQRRCRLDSNLHIVKETLDQWKQDNELPLDNIRQIIKLLSEDIKHVRQLKVKQEQRLTFFMKEAGANWRESKFIFAISAIQTTIYQENAFLDSALSVLRNIIIHIREHLVQIPTWHSLKPVEEMAPKFAEDIRYTQQRTEKWFEERKKYALTGSTLHDGSGLGKLKDLIFHYDQCILKKGASKDIDENSKKFMKYGLDNEIHALATLVGVVLPLFFPDMSYYEEGAHVVESSSGDDLFLVSPDGSIRSHIQSGENLPQPTLACEVKCPFPNKYTPPVHYTIPERYIPQLLAEMAALNVRQCVYLSWSKASSTIFLVKFHDLLWAEINKECQSLYGSMKEDEMKKRRPKMLNHSFRKLIKELMNDFYNENIEMLAEIPSVYRTSEDTIMLSDDVPFNMVSPNNLLISQQNSDSDIEIALNTLHTLFIDAFQLTRRKATETIVWLLSDIDREWKPEVPHAIPVAWCLKGYSLSVDIMRCMTEEIMEACYRKEIKIACVCFDGAFAQMAYKGNDGTPLTVLELVRTTWDEVKHLFRKKPKNSLLKMIGDFPLGVCFEKSIHNKVMAASSGNRLSKAYEVYRCANKPIPKVSQPTGMTDDCQVDDDLSCLPVEALDAVHLLECESKRVSFPGEIVEEMTVEEQAELDEIIPDIAYVQPITGFSNLVLSVLLADLQKNDKKGKWKNTDTDALLTRISTADGLNSMTVNELKVVIDHANQYVSSGIIVRKSWDKKSIVNGLARVLGDGTQIIRTVKANQTLKEQAFNTITRFAELGKKPIGKDVLEAMYATLIFPEKLYAWKQNGPVKEDAHIQGVGKTDWFAHAEYNSSRNQYEPKTLDAEHLFVNNRVFVTKNGMDGIDKAAWQEVATKFPDVLSRATVFDLIDRQSCQRAKEVFSEEVEMKMLEMGFKAEADYCCLMRRWYEAEDEPSLTPIERCQRWLQLKQFLVCNVDLTKFPPHGKYVKGLPRIQYEGFLQRIDIKIQLYGILQQPYNQRAIGTLVNETFFGELTDMEPCKLGCPKAITLHRLLRNSIEILHYRHNPQKRCFQMRTSARRARTVYPARQLESIHESEVCAGTACLENASNTLLQEECGQILVQNMVDQTDQEFVNNAANVTNLLPIQDPEGILTHGQKQNLPVMIDEYGNLFHTSDTGEKVGSAIDLSCSEVVVTVPTMVHFEDTKPFPQMDIIEMLPHSFDSQNRGKRKQRASKRVTVAKPSDPARGVMPVRQYHKCDESKILPTTRLGISLESPVSCPY